MNYKRPCLQDFLHVLNDDIHYAVYGPELITTFDKDSWSRKVNRVDLEGDCLIIYVE